MCSTKEYDYYAILNVPRDASPEQITLAYRKHALECHPKRDSKMKSVFNPPEGINEENHLPSIPLCTKWIFVNRAYDILSNPLRKEIYDRYGEAGLVKGVSLPSDYFYPYEYHGDCFKTFYDVFGSYSPYANLIDAVTNPPPLYSNKYGIGVKIRDEPIERLIYLELKEIYNGAIKRMKILRYEFCDGDNTRTENKVKVLVVPIAPGTLPGTRITFKEESDQFPTRIPADIIFVTADKPHEIFTRKGSDLHMNCEINLKQALCGFKFTINTIDERKINLILSDVISPNWIKELKGEGLPKRGNKLDKGNLLIHFNIKFPTEIPRGLKSKIGSLFNELTEFEDKN